jgi:hypothetical protein
MKFFWRIRQVCAKLKTRRLFRKVILRRNRFYRWTLLTLSLVLLSACGGNQAATSTNNSTASIQISGDINYTMSPDSFYATLNESIPDTVNLYFNEKNDHVLFLTFRKDVAVGTLPIIFGELGKAGSASATYMGHSADSQMMFTLSQGTITFDRVGNAFSGKFEFTSQGDVIGSGQAGKTVTVSGTFANIPMKEPGK